MNYRNRTAWEQEREERARNNLITVSIVVAILTPLLYVLAHLEEVIKFLWNWKGF